MGTNRDAGAAPVCLLDEKARNEMFALLSRSIPHPRPALCFKNPFELLCAVMLSAQTTDAAVNRVTPALFSLAPDAAAMAAASLEDLGAIIKSIGLWRVKAANLKAMADILSQKHGGAVPESYDELVSLPGVGAKTAYVVLNVAFGREVVAVDTHIFRVCRRTGLCVSPGPAKTQAVLGDLVPRPYLRDAHHLLILHGRHVCRARRPLCLECCLKDLCAERAGRLGPKPAPASD